MTNNKTQNPLSINPLNPSSTTLYTYLLSLCRLNKCEIAIILYIMRKMSEIEYTEKISTNSLNNIDVIDFCNLTGIRRSSFYRAYNNLINKGFLLKDKENIETDSISNKLSNNNNDNPNNFGYWEIIDKTNNKENRNKNW